MIKNTVIFTIFFHPAANIKRGIKIGTINVTALAITLGLFYGIVLFAIGILSWVTGWGNDLMALYSSFFPGFGPTAVGSLAGLIEGFVMGAIFGFVIGVLYNYFDKRIAQ